MLLATQVLSMAFISFSVVALSAPSDARKTQSSIQITLTEQDRKPRYPPPVSALTSGKSWIA
ncbi:MAG: hypothetical protein IPN42_15290 [Methylococcaceae bacterium]|nr:hypothetical protein [Methylococcaceae bacterium]